MQVLIIEILIRGNGESHLASSPSEYEPLQVAISLTLHSYIPQLLFDGTTLLFLSSR